MIVCELQLEVFYLLAVLIVLQVYFLKLKNIILVKRLLLLFNHTWGMNR